MIEITPELVRSIREAIASIESSGRYHALGPRTKKGDRAYGRYQVMGANIPSWTKEALGIALSPKEFIENPDIQDRVADYKMSQILAKYGNEDDVASVWFSGRPVNKAGRSRDVTGTSVPEYVRRFRAARGLKTPSITESQDVIPGANELEQLQALREPITPGVGPLSHTPRARTITTPTLAPVPATKPSQNEDSSFLLSQSGLAQGMLEALNRQQAQFRQSGTKVFSSMPWLLSAAPFAALSKMGDFGDWITGLDTSSGDIAGDIAGELMERAQMGEELAEEIVPAPPPRNPMEAIVKKAPEYYFPGGPIGSTLKLAGGLAVGSELLSPSTVAAEPNPVFKEPGVVFDPTPEQFQNREMIPIETPFGTVVNVNSNELDTLGWMALASAGAMLLPGAVKQVIKTFATPKWRPVKNGPQGLITYESRWDAFRANDDLSAGLLNQARKNGATPQEIEELQSYFRFQTQAGGQSIVHSAIKYGEAMTMNQQFSVKASLQELYRLETEEVKKYLHLWNRFEKFQILKRRRAKPGQPLQRVTHIQGMSENDVIQEISRMRKANPQLDDQRKLYRENVQKMRRFETTGEYATAARAKTIADEKNNPHLVPSKNAKTIDQPLEYDSPTLALADEMQIRMTRRMTNEARGRWVDLMLKHNPDAIKEVTKQQVKDNKHWNVITIYRRGVPKYYATSKFQKHLLDSDPYYLIAHPTLRILSNVRSWFENTTTSTLAPWFAVTSAIRSHEIAKLTLGPGTGFKTSTLWHSGMAIPRQLVPQVAKVVGEVLDRDNLLTQALGKLPVQGLSQRWSKALIDYFDGSFFNMFEPAGSARSSVMQKQIRDSNKMIDQVKGGLAGSTRATWDGWQALLNAVHNAPAFGITVRNYKAGKGLLKSIEAARHATGNPRVGGRLTYAPEKEALPGIAGWLERNLLDRPIDIYAGASEWQRVTGPWFNYTVQGIKRIAEAYVRNPVAFTAKAWAYIGVPTASIYAWNAAGGPEYIDYEMNKRSRYKQLMFWYIRKPGHPPEEGIEFPIFHELSLFKWMFELGLHHATHASYNPLGNVPMDQHRFSQSEDWKDSAYQYLGLMTPAITPLAGTLGALGGVPMPMNPLFEQAYKVREEPFEEREEGFPTAIELLGRNLFGALADVIGQGFGAYASTDDKDGYVKAIKNGFKQAGSVAASKTPLLRDVLNQHVPQSSDTQVTRALFKKNKFIRDLTEYYRKWDRGSGQIDTALRSHEGGDVIKQILREAKIPEPPQESSGLIMGAPTNPDYLMAMQRVYQNFATDTTQKDDPTVPRDVVGFLSLWNRRGDYTRLVEDMKVTNYGNNPRWNRELAKRPTMRKYLREQGVDFRDYMAVRNHWIQQRQKIDSILYDMISLVEAQMSKETGREIKLENLGPYDPKGTGKGEGAWAPQPGEPRGRY